MKLTITCKRCEALIEDTVINMKMDAVTEFEHYFAQKGIDIVVHESGMVQEPKPETHFCDFFEEDVADTKNQIEFLKRQREACLNMSEADSFQEIIDSLETVLENLAEEN